MALPTEVARDAGLWPEVDAAIARNQKALDAAMEFASEEIAVVVDNDTLQAANQRIRELATFGRELESARKDATGPIAQQKAYADAVFKVATDSIARAKSLADLSIRNYQDEQRRRREAAEERARQDAAKERRRKELLAQKATERGDEQRAMEHAEAAARVVERPVDVPAPAKLEGNFERTTWHAEVFDGAALPGLYLMPDMDKLNKVARAMGADFNVPGARAVPSTTSVQRSIR